jgi:hypothetical protein
MWSVWTFFNLRERLPRCDGESPTKAPSKEGCSLASVTISDIILVHLRTSCNVGVSGLI